MAGILNHPLIRLIRDTIRQFIRNQGILNASALTYTTLFAVVPLMTVTYSMLAAIPSFQGVGDQLQGWIFSNFVPTTGAVVQDYLAAFSSQARNLTAVGVAILAVTAIMMMKNIEAALNRIWRVSEPRKGLSSFLLYWAVLSLGPILIGLGLVLTSYIASLPFISSASEIAGKLRLLSLLPMLLSAVAFTLLYAAVPNCRVPLRYAAIGAGVVAVLFEAAKRGFAFFVTQSPSYELIYGAFAAVPLFLAWIYISWIIILLGAELTRSLTVWRGEDGYSGMPHLHVLLGVLRQLWQAQKNGETLSDQQLMRQVSGLNQARWDNYSTLLLDANIVTRNEQGRFLLCRDMSHFSLKELTTKLPWPLPDVPATESLLAWERELNHRLEQIASQQQHELNLSLEALFSEKYEDAAGKTGNVVEER
ncbi:YihY family inner membrane protein [Marinobacterium jannaschii]|uniref:YihY family inner membrane protein n=1 Tax=Marinobacterium jannaschii TaxID=64970 RepID=UPI00068829F9|nr:YihY family inner membrane protein [Marinobacterium jannaschii]